MFRVRPRARGELRARSRRPAGYARVGRAAEARLRARACEGEQAWGDVDEGHGVPARRERE